MKNIDLYKNLSFGDELREFDIAGLRAHAETGTWKTSNPYKHKEILEIIHRYDDLKKSEREELADSMSARSLEISKEALSIAKEANLIATDNLSVAKSAAVSASKQARWARRAAIIAMIAAIIATKDEIVETIKILFQM